MKSFCLIVSLSLMILTLLSCGKKARVSDTENLQNISPSKSELYTKIVKSIESALRDGDEEALKTVILENPDFDLNYQVVENGETLLTMSLNRGWTSLAHLLIGKGADLEKENIEKLRPLFVALMKGLDESVQIMLDRKVNIERPGPKGNSPLLWALKNRQDTLALLLIKHGANTEVVDATGVDAITLAELHGNTETLKLLQKLKKIDSGAPDIATFRRLLERADFGILAQVLGLYPNLVKKENYESINPLVILVESPYEADALKSAQLLIAHQTNINGPRDREQTPLIRAVALSKRAFAELFLVKGSSPHLQDKKGKTALIHAVEKNSLELVELMLTFHARKKYITRVEGRRVIFDACKVNEKVKKVLNSESERIENEDIEDRLNCGFFDWIF